MKKALLVVLLCFFVVGCASTNYPVREAVDGVYDGTKAVEQAVWDAM